MHVIQVNRYKIKSSYMKKIVLIALAVIFTAATMSAQSGKAFEKGYRGNVSLTGNIGVNKAFFNNGIELTTSHGYSFGDGVYIGGGIGLNVSMGDYVDIPVYLDMRYNILDWKFSPFVDCRVGTSIMGDAETLAFMASPGVGFDYRKMSFRVGYKCEAGWAFKLHTISIGTAVNF